MINISNTDSHVYFLVFPNINAFKIGKADDVGKRINGLSSWGQVDYNKSYTIKTTKECVYKIESMFHKLLEGYNLQMPLGDGYTEFFKIEGINVLIQHLDLFVANSHVKALVSKGVIKPKPKYISSVKHLRGDDYKAHRFSLSSTKFKKGIQQFSETAVNFFRTVEFLGKYRHKIPYQIIINDDYIEFRFIANKYSSVWVKLACKYMHIEWSDYNSTGGANPISSYKEDGIINFFYKIYNNSLLLDYFNSQLVSGLKMLPSMSPLLDAPIPHIDRDEMIRRRFSKSN